MPPLVFDTGPLSAFARASRLDILAKRFRDAPAWTVEVKAEIGRGIEACPEPSDILSAGWLKEPIRLTDPADLASIEMLPLGGTEGRPDRHRGEAATIVAASVIRGIAVLDDRDARMIAVARNVDIIGTEGILRACCRDGQLAWDEAWKVYLEMRRIGVRLRDITPEQFKR